MSTFPRTSNETMFKAPKGSLKRTRATKRRGVVNAEEKNKRDAKARDHKRCRRPACPKCHNAPNGGEFALHASHWKAKGQGGDKQLKRSQRKHLITLCAPTHLYAQEVHKLRLFPRDPERLCDGAVDFYSVAKNGALLYEGWTQP